MGIYDGPSDTPNQIKSEGQQIDVAFVRNGDGTGTIKWTIPSPVAGCSAEDQAYDGIIITVSDIPANYIESSPKDGVYYNADPTFDPDLHAGSRIDTARVVGAFYHDKTTRSIIVQNVMDRTPYYVSAYAVDDVARYHREGVHAYSLPTGSLEYNSSTDSPAMHDIGLSIDVVDNSTPTGLVSGTDYWFNIIINCVQHKITIHGHDALTYPNLVNAINAEFIRVTGATNRDLASDTAYYFDVDTGTLYKWNYDTYDKVPVTVSPDDPTLPIMGTYWYDGITLWVRESSAWVDVPIFRLSFNPSQPECGTLWYDGTTVRRWDDTHWCDMVLHVQETNPLLPPTLTCGAYWYDERNYVLNNWNPTEKRWVEANAIYSESDPNTVGPGDYWYSDSSSEMLIRAPGNSWESLVNIVYSDSDALGNFIGTPMAAQYWYDPSSQMFFKRNTNNTAWIELEFTLSSDDPTDRNSCDLWWNSSSVDDLFAWDATKGLWTLVSSFTQSQVDPSLPPTLSRNSVWLNPVTGVMQILITPECTYGGVEYIDSPIDPTTIGLGLGWLNSDGVFRVSDGFGGWLDINPILAMSDPYVVNVDDFWYDVSSSTLNQWNGSLWEVVTMLDGLSYPELGETYLNDTDGLLYSWNGTTWSYADAIAGVKLLNPNTILTNPSKTCMEPNRLHFYTNAVGCDQELNIVIEASNLFTLLGNNVMYYDPRSGNSRLELGPTWDTLGIGDDGSPDERRRLHTIIRGKLGAPSQKVELTDDQIDEALDSALLMIRKFSGFGYHRAMFFLDLYPNQQKYILTNRCVGFNKITDINYLYRFRSSFLNGNIGMGGGDLFGYAALTHLYRAGTFDMLSYYLVSSYIEDMQTIFADHLTYNWVEDRRELQLYHTIYRKERVLVDAYVERTEQELFKDRETREWIKRWAIADSKMILSQIRGKFQTLPGPGGSTTLNSQELITQGETEKADLLMELEDGSMQNLNETGGGSHFIMG